ncbi:DUF3618 domain-containing protein [Nonomuraea lactucae]|uniref:DUF3618 domain-containing protein n=1 Tax=Nonomuraea lactucae TaxID=2249762 RepID=UPI000DE5063B|nr:DUF3618 domain-containing protein [Nonomuraea lactucae]
MSETDPGYGSEEPGYSREHAGEVGAHRKTVGAPTDHESINVPQTRPGAEENALRAEAERLEHSTFDPEPPLPDDRTEAIEAREVEARSQTGPRSREPEAAPSRRKDPDIDNEEELVRDRIKETRDDLGQTVSALTHKADVKARATEAAGAAKGRAAEAAEVAKGKAAEAAEVAKGKATEAAEVAKGKAAEVADKVREATPDQVKDAADKVTTEARKRPVLLIAAAGTIAVFVLRRMARRAGERTRRGRSR